LELQWLILSLDLGIVAYFAQVVLIRSWTLELQWLIPSLVFGSQQTYFGADIVLVLVQAPILLIALIRYCA